jgi:hypothetical protein
MTDESLVPPSDQPVRIRWLNAAGKSRLFSIIIIIIHFFIPRTKFNNSETDSTTSAIFNDKNK